MSKLRTKVMLLAGLVALALLPGAKADEWNQKTVFTFSGPVEIPGQILPAGTYVPDHHLRPSDKTIIKFEERAAGSPDALKAWFYPGRTYGHEFVYPKTEALALAKANNTPVPSMPTELTPETTKPDVAMTGPEVVAMNTAPLKAEEPPGEEVELAKDFAPRAELPETLPTTATSLPLVLLIGLLSLGTAVTLRRAGARAK
jgi:hypothetical protein